MIFFVVQPKLIVYASLTQFIHHVVLNYPIIFKNSHNGARLKRVSAQPFTLILMSLFAIIRRTQKVRLFVVLKTE